MGWNPVEDLQNFVNEVKENPVDAAINATINTYTGGIIGYNNGQVTPGATVRAVDETLGEITGRNLAREQMNLAKEAAAEEARRRTQQQKDELERKRLQDVQASTAAGLLRTSEQAKMRGTLGTDGDPTRDFLGI